MDQERPFYWVGILVTAGRNENNKDLKLDFIYLYDRKQHPVSISISYLNSGTMEDAGSRVWLDPKVHQLYTVAMTSKDVILRRQALKFLGALQRVGNEEAARAIANIKRYSKMEN
jgi:hypothetical protein